VRRLIQFALLTLAVLVVAALVAAWMIYRATQAEGPTFYAEALTMPPEVALEQGDQFEQQVLTLRNRSRRTGEWGATVSDEQINGWLSSHLLDKLPDALPPGVTDPRVAIDEDGLAVACRYESDGFSTVLSLKVDAYLTDRPNQLALRFRSVRAGRMPLPLGSILEQLTTLAREANVPVGQSQQEGDPVVLITVPSQHPETKQPVRVEYLRFGAGSVKVGGSSGS